MNKTRKKTDGAVTNIVRLHVCDVCDIKKTGFKVTGEQEIKTTNHIALLVM